MWKGLETSDKLFGEESATLGLSLEQHRSDLKRRYRAALEAIKPSARVRTANRTVKEPVQKTVDNNRKTTSIKEIEYVKGRSRRPQRQPGQISVMGLDVGTSRIVLSWKDTENYSFSSQLNAFVAVPYTRMTENALRREGVPFEKHEHELVVLGNEAPRFADLLNVEMRRPMVQGVLNPAEPESLPVSATSSRP
jgi:hypothetical protein